MSYGYKSAVFKMLCILVLETSLNKRLRVLSERSKRPGNFLICSSIHMSHWGFKLWTINKRDLSRIPHCHIFNKTDQAHIYWCQIVKMNYQYSVDCWDMNYTGLCLTKRCHLSSQSVWTLAINNWTLTARNWFQ